MRAAVLPCLLALLFAVAPARAQTPDTTAADTTAAPADTVRTAPPDGPLLPLGPLPLGRLAAAALPVRLPVLDAAALLARLPGTFHYDPGTPGWPGGWSAYALPPDAVGLRLDGRPLDDGITGRPRFDLLPLEFLSPLRVAPGGLGAPLTVHAGLRPFVVERPYTELRYRSGGGGLQRIGGLHAQNRRRTLLGQEGLLSALFGYADGVADGEYPGARTRTRHLALRLRFYGPRWSAEIAEVNTLHRAGAHGGVLPFGGVFGTVYNRFDPRVRDPRARRQTRRNDLAATLRTRLLPHGPTTLTAYWTRLDFRYTDPDRPATLDTLGVRTDRVGIGAEQTASAGAHRLRARVDGWLDAYRPDPAATLGTRLATPVRLHAHAVLGDSVRVLGAAVYAEGGLHVRGRTFAPTFVVEAERPLGAARVFGTLTRTAAAASLVERHGFGSYVVPAPGAPEARTVLGRVGVGGRAGTVDASAFAFGHTTSDAHLLLTSGAVDAYGIAPSDTVLVTVPAAPVRYAGLSADIGWRRTAGRGFYGLVQPTAAVLLGSHTSPAHERLDGALPRVWVRARLGARYRLFRGDLDLDAYADGTAWTAFRGRVLHTPTGRYALPPADARSYGPSGRLDLVAEAGVRTATFFLAWENVLSGTVLTPGNLIVPVYPLPDRRFRFGVYWPILD